MNNKMFIEAILCLSKLRNDATAQRKDWFIKHLLMSICLTSAENLWKDITKIQKSSNIKLKLEHQKVPVNNF